VVLWCDVDDVQVGRPDESYLTFTHEGIGIVILETRACKSWLRVEDDKPDSFLGDVQFEGIRKALKEGELATVDRLVVCSPVPIAFLDPGVTDITKEMISDFEGLWTAFPKETEQFMDMLHEWKESPTVMDHAAGAWNLKHTKSGHSRELIIAAGDVHVAVHSNIFRNGKFFCSQVTSSAICNERVPEIVVGILQNCLSNGLRKLCEGGWQFEHNYFSAHNNYAFVSTKPHGAISARSIIEEGRDEPPTIEKMVSQRSKLKPLKPENKACCSSSCTVS